MAPLRPDIAAAFASLSIHGGGRASSVHGGVGGRASSVRGGVSGGAASVEDQFIDRYICFKVRFAVELGFYWRLVPDFSAIWSQF
jgi:hypothetical protein